IHLQALLHLHKTRPTHYSGKPPPSTTPANLPPQPKLAPPAHLAGKHSSTSPAALSRHLHAISSSFTPARAFSDDQLSNSGNHRAQPEPAAPRASTLFPRASPSSLLAGKSTPPAPFTPVSRPQLIPEHVTSVHLGFPPRSVPESSNQHTS
ncbi:Unknown protein, partial [Striga hermonthica]